MLIAIILTRLQLYLCSTSKSRVPLYFPSNIFYWPPKFHFLFTSRWELLSSTFSQIFNLTLNSEAILLISRSILVFALFRSFRFGFSFTLHLHAQFFPKFNDSIWSEVKRQLVRTLLFKLRLVRSSTTWRLPEARFGLKFNFSSRTIRYIFLNILNLRNFSLFLTDMMYPLSWLPHDVCYLHPCLLWYPNIFYFW